VALIAIVVNFSGALDGARRPPDSDDRRETGAAKVLTAGEQPAPLGAQQGRIVRGPGRGRECAVSPVVGEEILARLRLA
jgi:hypothetical protein